MQTLPRIKSIENVEMPSIIYGTAWKKERTADLVVQAVRCGFRGIDTACQPKHYNEAGIGEALERLGSEGIGRSEVFVQTKFTPLAGQDPSRIPYDPSAPLSLQVAQSFDTSRRNLRSDYVDSLVLHSPLFPFAALQNVWKAMETIHHSGGAKQLGISNCYDLELLKRLWEESEVKPAVVQNRFYADSGYDDELRRWCRERGIIYQSFWSLTANPHILGSREFFALSQKYDKTEAQVLYRYLNHLGIIPLIGTTSEEHMHEDLSIFEFDLLPSEIASIDALLGI